MVTHIWVNIGSGNVLLTYDIKSLPEAILTHHYRRYVAFNSEQFHKKSS